MLDCYKRVIPARGDPVEMFPEDEYILVGEIPEEEDYEEVPEDEEDEDDDTEEEL